MPIMNSIKDMLINICYWNDKTWCYEDEIHEFFHKESDWLMLSVPYNYQYEEIDKLIKGINLC